MRRWLIFLLVIVALVLAACGGDDSNKDNSSDDDNGDTATSSPPNDNTENDGESPPLSRPLPSPRADTPTFTPVPPTATATVDAAAAATQDFPTTDPSLCVNFRADTVRNQDSESLQVGEAATIYWFPLNADNITYLIQLYNSDLLSIYVDEIINVEYTFEASFFEGAINLPFYWQVIPYQNGVPLEACSPLDGEIFVTTGQGLTPSPTP